MKRGELTAGTPGWRSHFAHIADLISAAKARAYRGVNTVMIDLYWRIGEYISKRIEDDGWGRGVVKELSDYLRRGFPNRSGFSAQNLWRMRQFHDFYRVAPKLSALLRELSWTSNLLVLSKAKNLGDAERYLLLAAQERLATRALERRLTIEARRGRKRIAASPAITQSHPGALQVFRDSYYLEFLGLDSDYSESDLRRAIIRNLGRFILEFGRDFAFVGEEYRLQVGNKDFHVDLLFYHRGLRCLVAFELKIEEFKPEHVGQLSFYLEALDRDVRKEHENPSVGVILCKGKDTEVVEYSLSRTLSPALVAEYETKLPDRMMLEERLHEAFDYAVRERRPPYEGVRS